MTKHVTISRCSLMITALYMLTCCRCKEEKTLFYHSDGTQVKSTVALQAIRAELDSLKKDQFFPPDVTVYTSLRSAGNKEIHSVFKSLQDSLYARVMANNPNDTTMANFGKIRSTNAAVVVIEKSSGRILTYYSSSNCDEIGRQVPVGGLNKTFVYALGMQNGLTSFSMLPKSKHDGDSRRSVRISYITQPATVLTGIYEKYSRKQFAKFMTQIRTGVTIDARESEATIQADYEISLKNATNLYYAAGNEGITYNQTLIDSVADSRGKIIYRRKKKAHRLLSQHTASKVYELLSAYTQHGIGQLVRSRFNDTTFVAGNFAKTGFGNGSGWMFSIQKNVIIGVRHELASRRWRTGAYYNFPQNLTVPLWLKAKKAGS